MSYSETKGEYMKKVIVAGMIALSGFGVYAQTNAAAVRETIIEEYKIVQAACDSRVDFAVDKLVGVSVNENNMYPTDAEKKAAITYRIWELEFQLEVCSNEKKAEAAAETARIEEYRLLNERITKEKLAAEKETAKREKEIARVKALPNPRIGMTAKTVREKTNWGAPESINRTGGSWGVHEQWVYGGRSYLYFENGKLTSWQN
jgi:hypothetical protein